MPRHIAPALLLLFVVLIAAYVGSYFWVVRIVPIPVSVLVDGRRLIVGAVETGGDFDFTGRALRFYAPIHMIDRAIGRSAWETANHRKAETAAHVRVIREEMP